MADIGIEELTLEEAGLHALGSFKEMIEAGVFYGRKKTKTHPRMQSYIFANRGGIEIIDLQKTLEDLNKALDFLREKARGGALILFVGTQPPATGVLKLAEEFHSPFVDKRWIGGTLTNFKTISKRIEYFKKLKNDLSIGALQKYTKKERLDIEREIKRFEELLGGLQGLERLPDLLLVIDPVLHITAVREARKLKIPIVSLVNTDADPDFIDYPVPGNTTARKSIDWFLLKVEEALRQAKSEAVATKGTDVSPHEKQESV